VALKATAGLRLLPAGAADKLLDASRDVILSYPFQASKNVAEILDGSNEGVYCWVTLNYYMGAFHNRSRFYGTIDLGGGSVQITFLSNREVGDDGQDLVKSAADTQRIDLRQQHVV
jgi:Golgi nucleoside diphosphatase